MEPFVQHTGIAAPLERVNVDTDAIIPKQFLKRIERTGFGPFCFYEWRFEEDGTTPKADFALNQPRYQGASVLVAGDNFGCGSSREHAPWALTQMGLQVIIAPSFADIFYNNCFQNALLPIPQPQAVVDALWQRIKGTPGYQLTVDLQAQTVTGSDGYAFTFAVDPYRKHCMMNGLDDIGISLTYADKITAFEAARPAWQNRGV